MRTVGVHPEMQDSGASALGKLIAEAADRPSRATSNWEGETESAAARQFAWAMLDRLQTPAWAIDLDALRLVWANRAARQLLAAFQPGDRPTDPAIGADADPLDALMDAEIVRFRHYLPQFQGQQSVTSYWMPRGVEGAAVGAEAGVPRWPCLCSGLRLPDDRLYVLVECLEPRLERLVVERVESDRLQRVEAELRWHDCLLEGVAEAMRQLLVVPDRDRAVSRALALLGEALGADRACIFKNHPHPVTDAALMSLRWEWCRPGIAPQIDNLELRNLPYDQVCPGWYVRLARGESQAADLESALPPLHDWMVERSAWETNAFPIAVEGGFWGFLGFDNCHQVRAWSDSERSILSAAASSIGGAIARHQSEQALAALNGQLETIIEQRTFKLRAAVCQLQQEIGERKRFEEQLHHNAFHDVLTGLANRALLVRVLGEAIDRSQADAGSSFALLFLDVDRFKTVNDSLGHSVGDELLVAVAQQLRKCVRSRDLVARVGGDEFAILLQGRGEAPGGTLSEREVAEATAEKIHRALARPFFLSGQEVFATVSIGIALSSRGYELPEAVLRDADVVMYRAKARGRARSEVFDREVHQQVIANLKLETDLRRAVHRLEAWGLAREKLLPHCPFELRYQPIVAVATGQIVGFEALLQWHHPSAGVVSPARFIPIAEETGLIVPLGDWILYRACYQLRQWQRQFPDQKAITLAVNVSYRQFAHLDLVDRVDRAIAATGIAPNSLKLEITESTLMDNFESTAATLQGLRDRGIQICMDDFGTGYSSLSYLHRFPLDVLKIDRSFIRRIGRSGQNSAIVHAILTLARDLNMVVVAEGVETALQLQTLRDLGCDLVQGYLFAKPLRADSATELLACKAFADREAFPQAHGERPRSRNVSGGESPQANGVAVSGARAVVAEELRLASALEEVPHRPDRPCGVEARPLENRDR